MIFATYWFLIFAAVFFPLYWLARPAGLRLGLLLAGCFVFHAHFAGAAGMKPIIVLAIIVYLAGLARKTWALRLAMALAVIALCFYKYSHFLALDVIGPLSPSFGSWLDRNAAAWLPATPPLAISFFTFEFVHYLYDLSHGAPSIRNPTKFAAFTFFFPSLVAGPIKRYQPYLSSLGEALASVTAQDIQIGLLRVGVGFFKKMVIADNLTIAIDTWHPHYGEMTLLGRWAFVGALGARILTDFSGYSDIAIGLGRMAGVRLPENFAWPYLASNVREFWHRWHMSLSFWIRDYVYIPLGGNRRGPLRKALNALIAFGLIGLWHGPAWHFVFWGVYHGAGLTVSNTYRTAGGAPGRRLGAVLERLPFLGWALTMVFVFVGWIYFFYPMREATHMLVLLAGRRA